jgi:hypothetical protein
VISDLCALRQPKYKTMATRKQSSNAMEIDGVKKPLRTVKKGMKKGQKKTTPCENDPLRLFYTSLLKQNPNSIMAAKWLQVRGLLNKKQMDLLLMLEGMQKLKL